MTTFKCPEDDCEYSFDYDDKDEYSAELANTKITQHKRTHMPPIDIRGWKFTPYENAQVGTINIFGHIGKATLESKGQSVELEWGWSKQGIGISVHNIGDFDIKWDDLFDQMEPALVKALGGNVCQVCNGIDFEKAYVDNEKLIKCKDCGNVQETAQLPDEEPPCNCGKKCEHREKLETGGWTCNNDVCQPPDWNGFVEKVI